jgi:hypothetical protein
MQTTPRWGFLPVAKALGEEVGMIYSLGSGKFAL